MPRYDDKGENFYYNQEDFLFGMQKHRTWSYNVIRPNAIIGFTPGGASPPLPPSTYYLLST